MNLRRTRWLIAALAFTAASALTLMITVYRKEPDPTEQIESHAAAPRRAIQARWSAHVVGVNDGDTIRVLKADKTLVRIRFLGIDAPEKTQAFGEKCRKQLDAQVAGITVEIEDFGLDRYGRTLGKVWKDNRDVGLKMVEIGCAWHYRHFARNQPAQDRIKYSRAEQLAQINAQGLWTDAHPIAPWSYRKQKRGVAQAATETAAER